MDLNQIKYFLNLADTLNFTKAARLSGISQPSLTRSIQRLEDELGGPLVYRDGKDTRLTALGREMQVEFMRIDQVFSNIHELAENSVKGRQKTLQIGVGSTVAPVAIAPFWAYVMEQLPGVGLVIHPMLPEEGETEVLSGKYDMCVLGGRPKENFKLTIRTLYSEALMLAVAREHPLATQNSIKPEQLADQTYLDRLHCEFRSQLIRHFMDRNIVMRPRIQSEREDWIQQLVAEGVGVCSLPERSRIVEGIVLRPVDGLALTRDVTLVAISGSGNPREVRQIMEMAKNFAWQDPDRRKG
ncbi:MAG: LysR family transcriptional regulator [Nitratireductor sp.]